MTVRWALDLELEQPSNKIIQIGACKFDDSGIIDTFCAYVKQDEPLSEYIHKLTGITDEDLNGGTTLEEAFLALVNFTSDCDNKQAVVWGEGDMRCLREQLPPLITWPYGRRICDVKAIHQFIGPELGLNGSGGLSKTMNKYGLSFCGRKHNATADAVNTSRLYNKFKELIKDLRK